MKNKVSAICIIALFFALLTVENGAAQSKILVKAGLSFAFSDGNSYWGGGAGLEKQIGRRWSFSFTFEYLKTTALDSTAFIKDIKKYNSWGGGNIFNRSVWSVNPEFRFYPKKNPLVSLEGFFMALGLEVGQLETVEYNTNQVRVGNVYVPIISSVSEEKSLVVMSHLSLGSVFQLNEGLSLELSGGIKGGFSESNNGGITVIPIIAKLRYAF